MADGAPDGVRGRGTLDPSYPHGVLPSVSGMSASQVLGAALPEQPGRLADDLLRAAEAARWAPSIRNSQPWRLRRLADALGVLEDPSRWHPDTDPLGRDRVISCGAAALNARVTLQALGRQVLLDVTARRGDPLLVATVTATGVAGRRERDETATTLAGAVLERRTHRRIYRSHAVAEDDVLALRGAVQAEGARLILPDRDTRRRLAHLIRRACRGAPGLSTLPPEDFEDDLARSTVVAVSTSGDSRQDWALAGVALQRMLLTATTRSLVASFTDQPLQHPDLRAEAADLLAAPGTPQVLLRIGRALTDTPVTPRRPLAELLC